MTFLSSSSLVTFGLFVATVLVVFLPSQAEGQIIPFLYERNLDFACTGLAEAVGTTGTIIDIIENITGPECEAICTERDFDCLGYEFSNPTDTNNLTLTVCELWNQIPVTFEVSPGTACSVKEYVLFEDSECIVDTVNGTAVEGVDLFFYNVTEPATCSQLCLEFDDQTTFSDCDGFEYFEGICVVWLSPIESVVVTDTPGRDCYIRPRLLTPEPSAEPTPEPTKEPTKKPTPHPTKEPTPDPTPRPTPNPTPDPTPRPTEFPSVSSRPSAIPSAAPTITAQPSLSRLPTMAPSESPSDIPSVSPSSFPSAGPSSFPSAGPSSFPSAGPSSFPTATPSVLPSEVPSTTPTTGAPSDSPSSPPTGTPSVLPSSAPSTTPTTSAPSDTPSSPPTPSPSSLPSSTPSATPL